MKKIETGTTEMGSGSNEEGRQCTVRVSWGEVSLAKGDCLQMMCRCWAMMAIGRWSRQQPQGSTLKWKSAGQVRGRIEARRKGLRIVVKIVCCC